MELTKYQINGIEKKGAEHCGDCSDGQEFLNEPYYIDGPYGSKTEAQICSSCNTRYELPRLTPDRVPTESCFYYSKEKGDCLNDKYLCLCNIKSEVDKIIKQNEMEASKMNLAILKERYEETGICPHFWVKPNLLKTSEGEFQITSCSVCKTGVVDYKGTKYEDDTMKLVSFISTKGIEFENQAQQETVKFEKIIDFGDLKIEDELTNLFETKEEDDLNNLFI